MSWKKPGPDQLRDGPRFSERDMHKQRNQKLAAAGIFRKPPRGRRSVGSQTLSVCQIRRTTLSESVKIQNQKLPLARQTLRRFPITAPAAPRCRDRKLQRATELCAEADVGGEPPTTTTRVPTLTRP
jgi:hypothetical protein